MWIRRSSLGWYSFGKTFEQFPGSFARRFPTQTSQSSSRRLETGLGAQLELL